MHPAPAATANSSASTALLQGTLRDKPTPNGAPFVSQTSLRQAAYMDHTIPVLQCQPLSTNSLCLAASLSCSATSQPCDINLCPRAPSYRGMQSGPAGAQSAPSLRSAVALVCPAAVDVVNGGEEGLTQVGHLHLPRRCGINVQQALDLHPHHDSAAGHTSSRTSAQL